MGKSFKELIVWQRSMELVESIYRVTENFPKTEAYGLQGQMRRSAVSIPSNIAEGTKRSTKKDYVHFLRTANGSAAELETQLLLVERLYSLNSYEVTSMLLTEVQKMLTILIRKLS